MMSDTTIMLIPSDPYFVPDSEKQFTARKKLAEIAPDAEAFEIVLSESVQFFDCGSNFEKVFCPSCGMEIPATWWIERMNEDYKNGFQLNLYQPPCCKVATTLQNLVYDWAQCFGRFALVARNPNIGTLDETHHHELETLLGTKLIVIYQLL